MKLQLVRNTFGAESTIGELFRDGQFECFTLEDTVRAVKIPGKTAIPAGTYEVTVNFSPHFGRPLPLLLDVPEFEGVRIHPGNRPQDTEGCILVGRTKGADFVGESRLAFDALFPQIQAAVAQGKVTIEIVERRDG